MPLIHWTLTVDGKTLHDGRCLIPPALNDTIEVEGKTYFILAREWRTAEAVLGHEDAVGWGWSDDDLACVELRALAG